MRERLTGIQSGPAVTRVRDRAGGKRLERGAKEPVGVLVPFEQRGGLAPEILIAVAGLG